MVDLDCPKDIHDAQNDYPMAVEKMKITEKMLSPYAADLKKRCNIGKDTTEKLVPNLMDKEKYVLDIRNLRYYVDKGMIVKKIHRVITFDQCPWLKSYIDFNTEKRKMAKNEFERTSSN